MIMDSRKSPKERGKIDQLFQTDQTSAIALCLTGTPFDHFSQQLDMRSVMNETKATTSNFKLKFGMNDYDQSFTVDDVSA